jgi:hypothetical protein
VAYGGNRNPCRNRKGGNGHSPPKGVRAQILPDKRKRNRQHPLSHRHFGKYMVHEMGGRIGHAPAATRRTRASAFTGKRQDAVHAAGIAVNPHKTSCQNTAVEKRTQFSYHKPGNHTRPSQPWTSSPCQPTHFEYRIASLSSSTGDARSSISMSPNTLPAFGSRSNGARHSRNPLHIGTQC